MSETATLAGGCFWCLEAVFERLKGVKDVVSGYTGGHVTDPTYRQVCSGMTGHAEAVQVTYDPEVISYTDLLEIFFTIHDPTTMNRQGPDHGTQYRSAIFTHNLEQELEARQVIGQFTRDGLFDEPIVTEVVPLETFYPAEDYHQEYYQRNPNQPYCSAVITPKLAKLRHRHAARLNER